jgi:hypothetical protein
MNILNIFKSLILKYKNKKQDDEDYYEEEYNEVEETIDDGISWYTEKVALIAEFNKDEAYINSYFYSDLGGKILSPKDINTVDNSSISFVAAMTIDPSGQLVPIDFTPENNDVYIALAVKDDKLLIKRNEYPTGIKLTYNYNKMKAYLEFTSYKDAMSYFEHSLYGFWVFEINGNYYEGTKITYDK